MKISEMIKRLEEIKDEHGNLEIFHRNDESINVDVDYCDVIPVGSHRNHKKDPIVLMSEY